MKVGDRVYILACRKKSQRWFRYGTIREMDSFKALVVWDVKSYGFYGSWVEITQLKVVK
jgi:hypothetical protein